MSNEIRQLKDDVAEAVSKGRWKEAAALYLRMADLGPDQALWLHRAGEALRRLGQSQEAIQLFRRAADAYAQGGFTWKTVAVCRQILEIDPKNVEAGVHLARLAGRPAKAAPKTQATAAPKTSPPRRSTIPPGLRIAAAPLRRVLGGAPSPAPGIVGRVCEIRLDEAAIDAALERIGTPMSQPAVKAPPEPSRKLAYALDTTSLHWLVERLDVRHFPAGDIVLLPEVAGQALYLVLSGEVSVHQGERELERIHEGGFFGEVALVTDLPRYATVTAATDCDLIAVPRLVLCDLIDRQPNVLRTLLGFLRQRVLERLIRTSPLFAPFAPDQRHLIDHEFRFIEAEIGSVLIQEGHPTPGLFVLAAGKVEVTREQAAGKITRLAELGPGDIFGEISLITGKNPVATVRAMGKCWTLLLPRERFLRIAAANPRIFAYVSRTAEERQHELEEMSAGRRPYSEGHLDLD